MSKSDTFLEDTWRRTAVSLIVAIVIVAVVPVSLGLFIGGIYYERCVRFYSEEKIVNPVLVADQDFNHIGVYMSTSDGTACLYGLLDTKDQYARLDSRMRKLFGDWLIKDRMIGVSVRKKPEVPTP
jgi:hypothetical protein